MENATTTEKRRKENNDGSTFNLQERKNKALNQKTDIATRSATHETIRKISLVDLKLPRQNVYRPSVFKFPSSIIKRL